MQPSAKLKQSFQSVGLCATVLVVLIHYRSVDTLGSGINGLAQEWLVNGVARVAVPLFAFAAGFFYYLSDSGSRDHYFAQLRKRSRSVLLPYLLVSWFALMSWSALRVLTNQSVQLSLAEIVSRICLHPMAEQLWFLRDLLLLVLLAPLIRRCLQYAAKVTLAGLAGLWFLELQPAPLVAGWYALNIETLLFFCCGAYCTTRVDLLESWVRLRRVQVLLLLVAWMTLLGTRILVDPAFDLWYVQNYTWESLLLQKAAIILGCCSLLAVCGQGAAARPVPSPWNRLAGCSFFVYLIHEFPLREALERASEQWIGEDYRFWLAAPLALILCFAMALVADITAPNTLSILTGGRTPRAVAHRPARPHRPARWVSPASNPRV